MSVVKPRSPNSGPPFDALRAYLKRASGLVIEDEKLYLVESRLLPILQKAKVSGFAELVAILERGSMPTLAKDVLQAMTINETYFFRDRTPFDKFRDVMLPKLIAARAATKTIRIWSAACATGQEPYSLAMILDEAGPKLKGWRIEIVGTDLAEPVLQKAREGAYTQFEVQRGLPTPKLLKYFSQVGETWHLSPAIRSRVTFRPFNLLDDYSVLGRFDVIFCRNVLIYFDPVRKTDVLSRMTRALAPDGYIVLGAAESIIGLKLDLAIEPEHRAFLVRTNGGAQAVSPSALGRPGVAIAS